MADRKINLCGRNQKFYLNCHLKRLQQAILEEVMIMLPLDLVSPDQFTVPGNGSPNNCSTIDIYPGMGD